MSNSRIIQVGAENRPMFETTNPIIMEVKQTKVVIRIS